MIYVRSGWLLLTDLKSKQKVVYLPPRVSFWTLQCSLHQMSLWWMKLSPSHLATHPLWFWFYFYDFEYPQFIINLLYLTPAKRDILIVFLLCDKLPQMWQLKITWIYYPTVPVGLILGNPCWNLCLGSHGMNWRWQLVLQPHPGSVFKMINVSIIYFMKATT